MPLAGGSTLRQPPIYLTKTITFALGSGTKTTDVSSYNLGPDAVVLGGGIAASHYYTTGYGGAWCSFNVQLSADRQTVNWNWSNVGSSAVGISGLGAVILDFA